MNPRLSSTLLMIIGVSLAGALSTQAQAAAETVYAGAIGVTLDINIGPVTPVPTGDIVYCELTISISDAGGTGGTFTESVFTQAALSSSVYGTCSAKFPYQVALALPADDKVDISYSVYMVPSSGTGTFLGKAFDRSASNYLAGTLPVPANNGTSSITLSMKF